MGHLGGPVFVILCQHKPHSLCLHFSFNVAELVRHTGHSFDPIGTRLIGPISLIHSGHI